MSFLDLKTDILLEYVCLSKELCCGSGTDTQKEMFRNLTMYYTWLFAALFLHERKIFKSCLLFSYSVMWDYFCFLEVGSLQNVLLISLLI